MEIKSAFSCGYEPTCEKYLETSILLNQNVSEKINCNTLVSLIKRLLLPLAFMLLSLSYSIQASAQSSKVIIAPDGNEYLYIGEDETRYHVRGQDSFWVKKSKVTLKVYSAAKGQGYISLKKEGTANIREKPSSQSKVIDKLTFEEGMYPDFLRCLGKDNGWFKVKTYEGKIGYVKGDLVSWSALSF